MFALFSRVEWALNSRPPCPIAADSFKVPIQLIPCRPLGWRSGDGVSMRRGDPVVDPCRKDCSDRVLKVLAYCTDTCLLLGNLSIAAGTAALGPLT